MIVQLLACGADQQVVWDATDGSDLAGDIAVSVLTAGIAAEGDRELLEAYHATGTELSMHIQGDEEDRMEDWKITSLNPDICAVRTVGTDVGMDVELSFPQQGTTDLFVHDAGGTIRDWQSIAVRDPASTRAYPYEALAVGEGGAVAEIHVLQGSAATIGVAWVDAQDNVLLGTGVLETSVAYEGVAAGTNAALESSGLESFDVTFAADAELGAGAVALLTGGNAVGELAFTVHAESEVTAISLQTHDIEDDEDGEFSGTARAIVSAGEVDLTAAMVMWFADGERLEEGTWVEYGGDDPDETTELEACWEDLCDRETIPGAVTSVGGSTTAGNCGCASGMSGGGWVAIGLAWVLGRIRVSRRR